MLIKNLSSFIPAKENPRNIRIQNFINALDDLLTNPPQKQKPCKGIQNQMDKIDYLKSEYPHLSNKQLLEMANLTQTESPIHFTEL